MGELQQSVVQDQDSRHQISTQVLQWEENLERLHCEQFRLRCYMASLQSGELPNPKVILLKAKLKLNYLTIENYIYRFQVLKLVYRYSSKSKLSVINW